MKFAIDVVMVDTKGNVVHVEKSMPPCRVLLPKAGARHVIELRGGRADELQLSRGSKLFFKGVWD